MKIEDYNKEIESKNNIINRAIEIFSSTTTTAEDVANSIKSVELVYQPALLDNFEDFYPKLYAKIATLSSSNPNSTSLMFLARALQKSSSKNTDFENLDVHANVIIGDRVLEAFDNKILEEYYKET